MTDDAKRAALNIRTTTALKERLQAAAERSGRTMSQEADYRLELSFQEERISGGRETALLTKLISSAIALIEIETEHGWTEDRVSWAAVNAAVQRIVSWFQPSLDFDIWERHREWMFTFFEKVHELDNARREIEGLTKAYPFHDRMPAEAKELYARAASRYPVLLELVREAAQDFFNGPLKEQRERDREAIKLGRQIAGERKGDKAGSFIVAGVMRMYKDSASFEPLPGLRDGTDITEQEFSDCIRLLAGAPPDDPDMSIIRQTRTFEELKQERKGFDLREWLRSIEAVDPDLPDPANDRTRTLLDVVGESRLAERHPEVFQMGAIGYPEQIRPDMMVALPSGERIMIDAKLNPDDLSLEALRQRVGELAKQPYRNLGSIDHTILFVPNEAALANALAADKELWEGAFEQKVLVISPKELLAVLDTVDDYWTSEERAAQEARRSNGTTTAGAPETIR